MNRFGLFFTRDKTVLRLPVNPERLPVVRGSENSEYNVLGIGPVMVPRMPGLREVTISSYFPGRVFSGVLTAGSFRPPEFYIDFFTAAMRDRIPILYTPVRYYENGEPFAAGDSGFPVLVTQFNTEERGGETGDFYYNLTLTEYRDYSPVTMQISTRGRGQPAMAAAEPAREIPLGQLAVGCTCIANGSYYYTSRGAEPHGDGRGRRVMVSRIVSAAYPVHVTTEDGGALGWMKREALQAVSGK